MSDKETPLMRQYTQIKKKHPDTVLLFRLGDFFETFNEDAEIASKVCGLTLTKRNNGAAGDMPLAGFPHHQLDSYLPKLVRAGYRVAVCEQLEDPKLARGIVKRDVVEVVTPGVALYDKLLETGKNNYLAAINLSPLKKDEQTAGLSFCDISTGEFQTCELPFIRLQEILEGLAPNEIIISKSQKHDLASVIDKLSFKAAVTKLEPWIFDIQFGREALLGKFKTQNLKGFGIDEYSVGIAAAGAVLHYVKETQTNQLGQINRISIYDTSDYMTLDYATRRNLEITFSSNDGSGTGTLISILDKTSSPMGSRLFKKWITRPLNKLETIHYRLSVVRKLKEDESLRAKLESMLASVGDIERLISKICSNRANPRDLISLRNGLNLIPQIKAVLESTSDKNLALLASKLKDVSIPEHLITEAILDEPSVQPGSGNIFKKAFNLELDEYSEAKASGKKLISDYQDAEREKTGIPNLKVSFNNVFGFYIEITQAHKNKAPENYIRKQTLSNAERYTTPELKNIESKIMNAEEKIGELERELLTTLLMKLSVHAEPIQDNSYIISVLDCLLSYAIAANEYNYSEPQVDGSSIIDIENGRHPVVERMLPLGEKFFPNSVLLDSNNEQIHIITGPNMSGKSCYLRQVGLIVLLAHIGSFVPADRAHIGLVDRIFTRVGAQDNLTGGESTFLVEMQEAANIMNNATPKSLILLDEVGRGTATFDGISIAWAITEYIHNVLRSKTLFATHYHELNELAFRYENIANYQVEVIESEGNVIFSHKVKKGGSDHSFGIHVAQMAGLPADIIERSNIIMKTLEESSKSDEAAKPDDSGNMLNARIFDAKAIEPAKAKRVPEQLPIFELRDDAIRERLRNIDLNNLTPVQALQILYEMKKELKK